MLAAISKRCLTEIPSHTTREVGTDLSVPHETDLGKAEPAAENCAGEE